jgi:hypothetical protein
MLQLAAESHGCLMLAEFLLSPPLLRDLQSCFDAILGFYHLLKWLEHAAVMDSGILIHPFIGVHVSIIIDREYTRLHAVMYMHACNFRLELNLSPKETN